MKLIAIMPARNESWVIGASLRAALLWCDEVVVLNHASTDETEAILDRVSEERGRVSLIWEPCTSWSEMSHRQRLLEAARERGATHIALVDADEILTSNLLPTILQRIEALQPGGCLQTGMLAMWRSLDRYRVRDSIWANRFDLTLAFCDRPDLNWAPVNGYDHHSRAPHGSRVQSREMGGGVMHLQWASWRRLVAKHARYKMDERLKYPQKSVAEIDAMYSQALDERNLQLADAPPHWWAGYGEIRDHIDLTAEPWQEQQCREWMRDFGAERFKGLDLFGVC